MEVSSLPRPRGRVVLRPSPRLLAKLSDERLVEQVRRGNEAAFEVIFDRHHRGILAFCRHMLASQEEAEDAVQHTFISAYGDITTSTKEIRLGAWLFTIARNRCLSMLRGRREHAELYDIPTAGLSDAVVERDDLRQLLADLGNLPEDQRAALVLSELGDLSHAEVAETLGCEPMKVKSLVFQARSSLIASHRAREIPCEEIREQLASLRGGALRRGSLRRHLRTCTGCAEFRDEVRRQRKLLALVLPVVPTAALKHGVLAGAGLGSGTAAAGAGLAGGAATSGGAASAGGAVAGCGATGGGLLSGVGAAGAAKVALVAVVAVGGGAAVRGTLTAHDARLPTRSPTQGVSGAPVGSATSPATASPGASGRAGNGQQGAGSARATGGRGAAKRHTPTRAHGRGSAHRHGSSARHHGSGPNGRVNRGQDGKHSSARQHQASGTKAHGSPRSHGSRGGQPRPVRHTTKPPHPVHPAHPAHPPPPAARTGPRKPPATSEHAS